MTDDIVDEHEAYPDAAERIALDEEIDNLTAIRQLLAILSMQLEHMMCSGWEIEEALGLRTEKPGEKKLDA